MTKLEKLWGDPGKSARDLAKNQRSQELLSSNLVVSLKGSTRVLVRPIGLDVVEVASSNKCDLRSTCNRAPAARSPQGRNRLKPVSGNPLGPTNT